MTRAGELLLGRYYRAALLALALVVPELVLGQVVGTGSAVNKAGVSTKKIVAPSFQPTSSGITSTNSAYQAQSNTVQMCLRTDCTNFLQGQSNLATLQAGSALITCDSSAGVCSARVWATNGLFRIVPTALGTCGATLGEGAIQVVAGAGAVRSKFCACTFDGTTYAWQNLATANVGTTTTCP
jgi:ABC-type sugar transport system substrate-binding protein